MSDDDRLRDLLKTAHADDAAPSFRALLARRRRRRLYLMPLALAASVLALVLLLRRPSGTAIDVAALRIDSRGPLDFLLERPADALLTTTPRFDSKGDWK